MTINEPDASPPSSIGMRVLNFVQFRVFAYDFDPAEALRRRREPRERLALAVAIVLAIAFFAAGAWLVATGRVDNKPMTASTGLVGIHKGVTLDPGGWFADGIWWFQRPTPTPLPFTVLGFFFMVVGYSPEAVLILHAAIGAWCGYLLFRVCQNRFGGATGLIACLLLYSLPLFVYVTLSGWTFVWATTSLLLAITLLDRYHTSKRIAWYFLAAIALACAGMSRPENYMVAIIATAFIAAPWRYRPLFVLIAFTYPLLQYLHNNVYLGAPPALHILNDARSTMPLWDILTEWARDLYRSIGIKSFSPLFMVLGGVGVVVFGIPRRRFLTAILLYFFVVFAAGYAMRRIHFNLDAYYYAHLILLLPFLAHMIWRCGWIVNAAMKKVSSPPLLAWGGGAAVVAALIGWNLYQERNWLRSRLFFQIRPEIKQARDFIRENAAAGDAITLDSVSETSWLIGELENDAGGDIWFYAASSGARPKANAARADAPAEDIQAMNAWVGAGFREWARSHRPRYLLVASAMEWAEISTKSGNPTPYRMFGLRPALGLDDFTAVPLDEDGSLLRGRLVFQNDRIWVYETEMVQSTSYTLLKTDFEDMAGGQVPAGWTATPAGGHQIVAADAAHGQCVVLNPMKEEASVVGRKISDAEIVPGRLIEIKAEMKANEPHVAVLVLAFPAADGSSSINIKPEHPGDGQWHTITAQAEVPAGAVPGLCYVSVVLRPGASQPVFADNLSVRVLRESGPPK